MRRSRTLARRHSGRGRSTLSRVVGLLTTTLLALAPVSKARAACVIPILSDYVDGFVRHPEFSLQDAPAGGEKLTTKVRTLATAGYGPLKAIESIVSKANLKQKAAIGEGLARANQACLARSGEIAHRIDDSIKRIKDRDVTRAYLKVLLPDDAAPQVVEDPEKEEKRKVIDLDGPVGGQLKTPKDFFEKKRP